jgi:protease-4
MSKHGIKMNTITAGKNKNVLNIDQPLTTEQRAIMQSVADECYNQFTQIVAEGRNLPIETVKTLADGRIYTAQQAKNNKLIDDVNEFSKAKEDMKNTLFEGKNINFTEYKYKEDKNFYKYLFDMYSSVKGLNTQTEFIEKIMAESNQIDYPAFIYLH